MTQICNSCIKNNKCLYTSYIIENIDIDEVDDSLINILIFIIKNLYFTILIVNLKFNLKIMFLLK